MKEFRCFTTPACQAASRQLSFSLYTGFFRKITIRVHGAVQFEWCSVVEWMGGRVGTIASMVLYAPIGALAIVANNSELVLILHVPLPRFT